MLPRVVLAAALAALLPATVLAKDPPCEFDGVPRVVAVGDVHGAYGQLQTILRAAGLIDERDAWIGGRAHLVQIGDVVDRGPDSRKAIDLYRRLEKQAKSAGGQVHYLIGNHEALRLIGDVRYATPGEFAAFANSSSESRREALANRVAPDQRARILEQPLGMIELNDAFAPGGQYGSYLLSLNTVVRINGVVFVHGGISPAVAAMPCAAINATVRRELGRDLDKTIANQATSLSTRADGPLWYRGLATEPDTFGSSLDGILAAQHARALVVGHTPWPTGRIASRFDGRVFFIDTGIQTSYVANGHASALEIVGDAFRAIYVGGTADITPAGPVLISSRPTAAGAH